MERRRPRFPRSGSVDPRTHGAPHAEILFQRLAEPDQGRDCCSKRAGIPYEAVPIDTRAGDQFKPEFLAINPNGKVPAIDDDGAIVFDSNAILLYLAEKTGKFLPANTPKSRGELLSWLMFVASGVGPFFGQAVHFKHFAPEKIDYANNRYQFEAQRHLEILDERLAKRRYMLGDTYTIVDMGGLGLGPPGAVMLLGEGALDKFPNVKRLTDEISARPAAAKAVALKDKFKWKTEMDDEARAQHVQAPRRQGRLIALADSRPVPADPRARVRFSVADARRPPRSRPASRGARGAAPRRRCSPAGCRRSRICRAHRGSRPVPSGSTLSTQ